MPAVMDGAGFVQTRYPVLRRTGLPRSSTTSTAMPGEGPPSVQGFNGWMGSGSRKQPMISVPPEMLMMGQRRFPMFSKNQSHDVSSQGSAG